MARCKGTTLEGERCKREVHSGAEYCVIHEDQAPARASHGGSGGRGRRRDASEWNPDTVLKTALGVAVLGVIILLRMRR